MSEARHCGHAERVWQSITHLQVEMLVSNLYLKELVYRFRDQLVSFIRRMHSVCT